VLPDMRQPVLDQASRSAPLSRHRYARWLP
jgi:hypothetical protein